MVIETFHISWQLQQPNRIHRRKTLSVEVFLLEKYTVCIKNAFQIEVSN